MKSNLALGFKNGEQVTRSIIITISKLHQIAIQITCKKQLIHL